MRGRSKLAFRSLTAVFLMLVCGGCQLLNNKWIRVKRGKNPDAARVRLKLPMSRGPKESIEKFFRDYTQRDWKAMEFMMTPQSDLRFLKDTVQKDFTTYTEMTPDVMIEEPVFNKDENRAQVNVTFSVEKIHRQTGALIRTNGKGTFVLADHGNWDIVGYIGDPFWGEGAK